MLVALADYAYAHKRAIRRNAIPLHSHQVYIGLGLRFVYALACSYHYVSAHRPTCTTEFLAKHSLRALRRRPMALELNETQ